MNLILIALAVIISNFYYMQTNNCKEIFQLQIADSIISCPVYICTDSSDDYYYYSTIMTPVCEDTLCQLVQLNIFWDLAGNFTKFDTLPGAPLTKYDHKLFSPEDYTKLHSTLMNKNSILEIKNKNELIDSNLTRYSEKLDGVTGATAKEIKSSVVDGAIYSTYTLWHIVNGSITKKLREHTNIVYNPKIQKHLLGSSDSKTLLFVLKKFTDEDYIKEFEEVLKIMDLGIPVINFYIAKNLPRDIFANKKHKDSLRYIWSCFDRNTKSVLRKNLFP